MTGMKAAEKSALFVYMRQAYGRTALMLSGGGGLGIYHIGIVKALFEADLLPRIISGSSAGLWMMSVPQRSHHGTQGRWWGLSCAAPPPRRFASFSARQSSSQWQC